jgi:hypothetical protein
MRITNPLQASSPPYTLSPSEPGKAFGVRDQKMISRSDAFDVRIHRERALISAFRQQRRGVARDAPDD